MIAPAFRGDSLNFERVMILLPFDRRSTRNFQLSCRTDQAFSPLPPRSHPLARVKLGRTRKGSQATCFALAVNQKLSTFWLAGRLRLPIRSGPHLTFTPPLVNRKFSTSGRTRLAKSGPFSPGPHLTFHRRNVNRKPLLPAGRTAGVLRANRSEEARRFRIRPVGSNIFHPFSRFSVQGPCWHCFARSSLVPGAIPCGNFRACPPARRCARRRNHVAPGAGWPVDAPAGSCRSTPARR